MPDPEVEVLPLRRGNCHPEKAVLVLADGMNRTIRIAFETTLRWGGVFFSLLPGINPLLPF